MRSKGRTKFHITYDRKKEDWKIKREKSTHVESAHPTKAKAVGRGRQMAKVQRPSQIVIHKKDGTIQEERTYGNDPFPPRG